jgi:carboxylesterase
MPLLPGAEPFTFDGGPVGVLLLHGFTGSPQSLRPWGEHLATAGLTVVCPRLPGHGTRWQDLNLTRWPDWYGEAEHAFGALHGRCTEVFVMGLSMGGCLALRLAEQHPAEVAGLALVNPSVLTGNRLRHVVPLLQFVVPSAWGLANDVKQPGARELAYDRTPLRALASLARLWALTRADLGRVTAPLLLFTSLHDHVVEPRNSEVVLCGVGSADKEQRVLEDSYHVATLDNDAPTIFRESLQFVREHSKVLSA